MRFAEDWHRVAGPANSVALAVDGRDLFRIEVLEPALFRLRLLRNSVWRLDRSWTVDPDRSLPWQGRHRDAINGFSCPEFESREAPDGSLTVATAVLRVTVHHPLRLRWEAFHEGRWQPLAEDRPTGAYALGRRSHAHAHYMLRHPGERIYGLGEKTGPLERSGRRYEMRNLDAMGYDAARTDPLYKHIPFTLTRTPAAGSYSLFYDTLATCRLDLGNEIDNYHAPYRLFSAGDGDLDLYFAWAPRMADLVARQQAMTGGMAFPPRWSLGYSGSTMSYTDAPDAQVQLAGFLGRLDEHEMPCDSFHLSSGYTSIGAKRYVFHWNRDKFPDPEALIAGFASAGVRIVANVKPCLLRDHPLRAEAEQAGLFVPDSETGAPALSPFWDDKGSHLDFTNPATIAWWKDKVRTELLDRGIAATWNDNNEFELWDHEAPCAGFGQPVPMGLVRPLHALLMTRASEEAQRAHAPARRPYLVTRSGCAGLQRHAQTWTGDNRTGWDTLRWNIRMGLGLALSGISNIGHDVGGFAGARPEAELLLRWVQNGIFHPRFSIHSWNPDGTATEPWTWPEVLPEIRAALRLRYRLLPYLYTCLWQAVTTGAPMLRPTFLDHDHDPACFEECDDFLLGGDLLVASVVEQGARSRAVYLPDNTTGWWDFHDGSWHAPGQRIAVPVGPGTTPLFVRAGAVLPLAERSGPAGGTAAESGRELALFPAPAGAAEAVSSCYDDAGDNADALDGNHCLLTSRLEGDADTVSLAIARSGRMAFPFHRLRLSLPAGELRRLQPFAGGGLPDAEGYIAAGLAGIA